MKGGACPCQRGGNQVEKLETAFKAAKKIEETRLPLFTGGYTATARDKYYLRKYRSGKSIGFTMKASLKSKGLLPRNSKTMRGKKVVGKKYR